MNTAKVVGSNPTAWAKFNRNIMKIDKDKFYIVRADRAGVFFGKISEKTATSVTMTDVRKIHYWEGAAAVEEISQAGVSNGSRLTVVVPEIEIDRWVQILPCTEKAIENLQSKAEWKRSK